MVEVLFKSCSRCKVGDVVIRYDMLDGGDYDICLQCGHRRYNAKMLKKPTRIQ